jgi:hypothetical protein
VPVDEETAIPRAEFVLVAEDQGYEYPPVNETTPTAEFVVLGKAVDVEFA